MIYKQIKRMQQNMYYMANGISNDIDFDSKPYDKDRNKIEHKTNTAVIFNMGKIYEGCGLTYDQRITKIVQSGNNIFVWRQGRDKAGDHETAE